jgi:hypothetical protein
MRNILNLRTPKLQIRFKKILADYLDLKIRLRIL